MQSEEDRKVVEEIGAVYSKMALLIGGHAFSQLSEAILSAEPGLDPSKIKTDSLEDMNRILFCYLTDTLDLSFSAFDSLELTGVYSFKNESGENLDIKELVRPRTH